MVELMERYFTRIGAKACCFEDLKPYLDLPDVELKRWSEYLEAIKDDAVRRSSEAQKSLLNSMQADLKALRRSINVHMLLRYNLTSSELTAELESARATSYLKDYTDGMHLGLDLLPTDLQPGDDLLILAAEIFVNIWAITTDETHLYNAAVLLEFGLTKSKHAFQMRLMLIRIYRLLGTQSEAK